MLNAIVATLRTQLTSRRQRELEISQKIAALRADYRRFILDDHQKAQEIVNQVRDLHSEYFRESCQVDEVRMFKTSDGGFEVA